MEITIEIMILNEWMNEWRRSGRTLALYQTNELLNNIKDLYGSLK